MTETLRPRILIVDDEQRFRITLSKLLKAGGLEAIHAGGAGEALDLIRNQEFDVIQLDVTIPGMNGIEALAEIKKIRKDVEVIMLTGHASVDMAMEIMRLGGYDYLLKPCPMDELMLKIETAYDRKLERVHRVYP
jgi:DNA-binding NtrC family response regulator